MYFFKLISDSSTTGKIVIWKRNFRAGIRRKSKIGNRNRTEIEVGNSIKIKLKNKLLNLSIVPKRKRIFIKKYFLFIFTKKGNKMALCLKFFIFYIFLK